jgi:HD-GYP domain-containing protein (c-di-GMP phosphodiesterase class II)
MTLLAAKRALLAKPARGRRWILLLGLIVSIAFSFFYIFQPSFLRFLENKWYDTLLKSRPHGETSSLPVIVDIDEKSLAQFGQWPWPRYRVGLLLEKMKNLGALSIGLDMVFPESDRTSLDILQKDIQRDLKTPVDFSRLPKFLMDNDKLFAHALSQGPFVLGYSFIFSEKKEKSKKCHLHPVSVAVIKGPDGGEGSGFLFKAQGAVCSLDVLSEAVRLSGFFNAIKDPDGVLRRAPLLIEHDQQFYPSLALATLIQAYRIKQIVLRVNSGGVETIALDGTVIPVDAKGSLLIRYRGKAKSFKYISAGDVLLDLVPKEQIQGNIVFLGSTAVGTGEFHAAPLDPLFPGTEVHATIIDNITKKDFLSRPHWVPGLELLLVLGSGIFSTLLLTWAGAVWSLFILGLLGLGLWETSAWAFQTKGVVISSLMPLITLASNFSFLTLLKYWQEEQKVKAGTKELASTQEFTIQCLASLTETRDSETGGHILRCQRYVKTLSKQLAVSSKLSPVLNDETIDLLYKSAPLHDIGKVGISDSILRKPAKLTEDEFEEMKKHTVYGRNAIETAERKFGDGVSNRFLQFGKEMAYTHHEKWDGSGYPEGLNGENISFLGRIMAIADVYDALISKRPYKPPFTHEEAVSFIARGKGTHFDPDVVDAFLEVHEEFRKIASELPDLEK